MVPFKIIIRIDTDQMMQVLTNLIRNAVEAMTDMPESEDHPQGPKRFNGKTHQTFGQQYISKVSGGKLVVEHTASIEDGMYEDEVDYTKQSF